MVIINFRNNRIINCKTKPRKAKNSNKYPIIASTIRRFFRGLLNLFKNVYIFAYKDIYFKTVSELIEKQPFL